MISRRAFLKSAAVAMAMTYAPQSAYARTPDDAWREAERIARRIFPPRFPKRSIDVVLFDVVGNGVKDCAPGFRAAIERCASRGGGTVRVPRGNYLFHGPIRLLSNVHLMIEDGAILRFGGEPSDYLPPVQVRWEGTRCMNYSPMIYAHGARNIAITGGGTIDGGADRFESWLRKQQNDQTLLRRLGRDVVPVSQRIFGDGHFLRPGLFQAYGCTNLHLEGLTLKNSPFWTVHPVFCSNVILKKLDIGPGLALTDDGIDPDSCRDVLIEHCTIRTRDDQIAIKAGRDAEGRSGPPCENIVIRDCTFSGGTSAAIAIGSEMSGGVRNVFVERCSVPEVDVVVHLKSNTDRGGTVERVWVRNLSIGQCQTCIQMETDYNKVPDHEFPSTYRELHFENIRCEAAKKIGISMLGRAAKPITLVELLDIDIRFAEKPFRIENAESVTTRRVFMNGAPITI